MNNVSGPPTSGKQLTGPILSGDAPEDRALWNLSLVLLEIAEKRQIKAVIKPQNQSNVEEMVSGKTD
jgi:hypothetical protein